MNFLSNAIGYFRVPKTLTFKMRPFRSLARDCLATLPKGDMKATLPKGDMKAEITELQPGIVLFVMNIAIATGF